MISAFNQDGSDLTDMLGEMIGNQIISKVENGELSLKDEIVTNWIPCIYAEGNLKFLMALARTECDDKDYDAVMKFLLKVNQARLIGTENLENIKED